jgi:hypothetical protein
MKKLALFCVTLFAIFFLFTAIAAGSSAGNRNQTSGIATGGNIAATLTHWSPVNSTFVVDTFNANGAVYDNTHLEGNNHTVRERSEGNYRGLYSFSSDANGSAPAGWTGSNVVIDDVQGHHKVACVDNQMYQYISDKVTGYIDFWVYVPYTAAEHSFLFKANNWAGGMALESSFTVSSTLHTFHSVNYTASPITLWNFTPNSWIYLSFSFNCTSYTYDILRFWDGSHQYNATGLCYEHPFEADTINFVTFESSADNFIDSVDYSWAGGYSLCRSYLEGFPASGQYLSAAYDLGDYTAIYLQNISFVVTISTPETSFDLSIAISADNVTWSGWVPLPDNVSLSAPLERYFHLKMDFATSDPFYSSRFYYFSLSYATFETNEMPTITDVQPANATTDLDINVNVNALITDPDGDLLNVSFYLNNVLTDKLVNWNESYFVYAFGAEYTTTYTMYWVVNDSEDCVNSGNYTFSTLTPPSITDILVIKLSEFSYNISAIPTQYSSGMLDLALYWSNDTQIEFWMDCANNTRVSYILNLTDYGSFEFYFEVNVGGVVVSSHNFDIIIAAPSTLSAQLATMIDWIILLFSSLVVLGIAAAHKVGE